MDMDELADGFALWQEHRPHSREDWLNIARRWHQKNLEPPDDPSPMFGALYDAWGEIERLRAALIVAADDLAKAANQFAGLRETQSWPIVNNPETFAEKAERARAAALHWEEKRDGR